MRIIAGKYKGRRLKEPDFKTTRPTKDRIREAVFSIIAGSVPGAKVLDIFSGSGAYGLEALSRGAESVVFIEKGKRCIDVISENIRLFEARNSSKIMPMDAFKAIRDLAEASMRFDLIFADPPYNTALAKKILIMINRYDILSRFGLAIIEHHKDESIFDMEDGISIYKQKAYRDIFVSIFIKK